ncbi:MAG: phospho-N-acetylmuramoyl-pentapeptide-transferase [Candidatus Paceibacteria bacterium]|jgi:phospho-N-acetylmuramoyl-pentapeptide-transferase
MLIDVVKVILPSILAFFVGILITPAVSGYLYRNKMWKKKVKSVAVDGRPAPVFASLHKDREMNTPRMGGVIVWISSFIVITGLWSLAKFLPFDVFDKLDFLSRNQTWIPLATLLLGGFVGLVDDYMEVSDTGDHHAGGLSLKKRLVVVGLIGLIVSFWFYTKLGISSIGFPFIETLSLGWLIIPFFTLVILALYSGGVIDGIDGLAGGVFAIMFSAYALIAFAYDQVNLAAFCALIVGGLLAFLWFNIPPARFYMSETGTMGLTVTLGIVAFMTDNLAEGFGIFVLPIIAMPLVLTTLSVIIQVLSKKFRNGKKVFLSAPIHHHFEAKGWPPHKVTMRYWVLSTIFAVIGVIVALVA